MKTVCLAIVLPLTVAGACTAQQSGEELAALLERVRSNPKDMAAFLELGKCYCFERGEWKPGLFYLAQGSDAKLRLLAQRDLARPEAADDRIVMGDAWWDAAEKESKQQARHLRLRAVYWYRQAVTELSGLRRGRIESRIRMVDEEK